MDSEHNGKYDTARKRVAGHEQYNCHNYRRIEDKSCHTVRVKPGPFDVFALRGIYDMKDHCHDDEKHTKTNCHDKHGVQWLMGRIHSAGITSSKPKILPKRNPNIVENTPAVAMIPASGAFLKW